MRKYLLGKFTLYFLFFPISHCSLSLLYFGINCWLDVSVIEFILNMLISIFVCEVDVGMSIFFFFGMRINWFSSNYIVSLEVIFLFSSLHLISVSFPTIGKHIWEFFRLLGRKRRKSGNTSHVSLLRIPCSVPFRTVHHSFLLY